MTLEKTFEPLREVQPSEHEVASVVAAAARAPRRRPRRRSALALAGATACVALVLAGLPSDEPAPVSTADRPAEPETPGSSLLRTAAAIAADQESTGNFDGYRYTRLRERWTYTIEDRSGTFEQDTETWVDSSYEGRMRLHEARHVAGDRELTGRLASEPSERAYVYGDGPRERVEDLPTEPGALREALTDSYRRHMAPGRPADDEHYDLVRRVLVLLATPTTTPELRAGLFGVLAELEGVEPAPEARDALGRSGTSVTIPTRRSGGLFTIIFDSETSEMLFWSEVGSGGGTPDQSHTLVRSGRVDEVGERP